MKILFVCTGNASRSAAAEAVLKKMLVDSGVVGVEVASCGAVAGNITGGILGYSAIPEKYITNLELHDVILSIADDLAGASSKEQIIERYKNHKPYGVNENLLL